MVYFSDGDLIRKVLASSCIPGVFNPIMIEGKYYVDGGVFNNFPIEPLQTFCDVIIGSSCNHLNTIDKFRNMKDVIKRAAILSINHNMEEKIKTIDVLVEPKGLGEISIFNFSKAEDIFWLAHEEALFQINKHKELLGLEKRHY